MTPAPDRGVSPDPIEAMAAALAASNPILYRHLALYLQVLRQVLPARVEQACFHLATQVHPQRYGALAAPERTALHGRILVLVQRCSSLLAVEQLTALADQMDRENQLRQRRQQRELLADLSSDGGSDDADGEGLPDQVTAELPPHGALAGGAGELPSGSIRLDLSLPLSADLGSWRALGPPSPAPGLAFGSQSAAAEESAADARGAVPIDPQQDRERAAADDEALPEVFLDPQAPGAGGAEPGTPDSRAVDPESEELEGQSLQQRLAQGADAAAILRIVREAMEDSRDPGHHLPPPQGSEAGSPWREARLPRDPVTLLRWLEGFEKALLRRLRNLSHALNVELMRAGLIRGLLPVSLLDAVLEGQVDTMASPSNLLHLQLPFSLRPGLAEVQALVILLRPVDLEMDEPRLRTCRRRLHQQRQELIRMAHQFRRLQRRLQAHEAERLWLQDIRNSHPPRV